MQVKDGIAYLSSTSIDMFRRCPKQWYFRYIEGRKIPPGGAIVKGVVLHDIVRCDLQSLISDGLLLCEDTLLDMCSDGIDHYLSEHDVVNDFKSGGGLKDDSIKALLSHHRDLCVG